MLFMPSIYFILVAERPNDSVKLAVSLNPSTWLSKLQLFGHENVVQLKIFPSISFKPTANKLTIKNFTWIIFVKPLTDFKIASLENFRPFYMQNFMTTYYPIFQVHDVFETKINLLFNNFVFLCSSRTTVSLGYVPKSYLDRKILNIKRYEWCLNLFRWWQLYCLRRRS